MGVSQIILKVRQSKIISVQRFDVIFFHNMLNLYKFADKKISCLSIDTVP